MLFAPNVLTRTYAPSGDPPNFGAQAGASVLGAASAVFNTLGSYLRGETVTDQTTALMALRVAGVRAQADQAVNSAEAGGIVAVARARLQQQAANAPTPQQQQTAQQALTALDRVAPAPPSGVPWAAVVIGVGAVGAASAMFWWTTR